MAQENENKDKLPSCLKAELEDKPDLKLTKEERDMLIKKIEDDENNALNDNWGVPKKF